VVVLSSVFIVSVGNKVMSDQELESFAVVLVVTTTLEPLGVVERLLEDVVVSGFLLKASEASPG
jgi:hypothetical protein